MHYLLLDRFLELEEGRRALAVKCVTKGEPFMAELPAYPSPLVLEALIQCGGMLTRAGTGYKRSTVLGKVERAKFVREAMPGDTIRLEVKIELPGVEPQRLSLSVLSGNVIILCEEGFELAEAKGPLSDPEYKTALENILRISSYEKY